MGAWRVGNSGIATVMVNGLRGAPARVAKGSKNSQWRTSTSCRPGPVTYERLASNQTAAASMTMNSAMLQNS
jgi:hypothetical protein